MRKYLKPFMIIKDIPCVFWSWFIFCIIFGQFGILTSIALSWKSDTIGTEFGLNLANGNFYTFAIALLGASFFPFFLRIALREEIDFVDIRLGSHLLAFVIFITMVIFFVANPSGTIHNFRADLVQLLLYISGILLSVYLFCLDYLHIDPETYKELNDSRLKSMLDRSRTQGSDGRGNKL